MISLVLAAGYATRMYPLTENFPKPLLPVGGVPILTRLIEDIDATPAIERHVVVTNHRFIGHFEDWARGLGLAKPLTILDDGSSDNDNRLGAVRDVQFAIESLGLSDDLLVLAGDNLLTFSLSALVDAFGRTNHTTVFCYYEPEHRKLQRCGVIVPDENMRVLQMIEKPQQPPSNWAVPPFYAYAKTDLPKVSQAIEQGAAVDAPGSFIAWLCQCAPVFACEMPGRRIDVGDLDSYAAIKDSFSMT